MENRNKYFSSSVHIHFAGIFKIVHCLNARNQGVESWLIAIRSMITQQEITIRFNGGCLHRIFLILIHILFEYEEIEYLIFPKILVNEYT